MATGGDGLGDSTRSVSVARAPDGSQPEPPEILSIGRETWIYERPSYSSRRLGYLRFAGRVARRAAPSGHESCANGWFRIVPEGYVCANDRTATTNLAHPIAAATEVAPDRDSALPYHYAMARRRAPTYLGDPGSAGELAASSPPSAQLPDWWRRSSQIFGFARDAGEGSHQGLAGSGIAWSHSYEQGRKRYGLTPHLELVELEALEPVTMSSFHGYLVDSAETKTVAFVKTRKGWLYRAGADGAERRPTRLLAHRESFGLLSSTAGSDTSEWLKIGEQDFVRRTDVRLVSLRDTFPPWVRSDTIWVDVSIEQQTLVAYEGQNPKYVTLVSTGADGISDPKTTKATKMGVFSIVSKHLTSTMDGQDETHAYEMNEVPWVQYFSEGYALHAAYWHDDFGRPRSHGCVNLSPIDARWLFHFTSPGVPKGWHGRTVSAEAATVYVHP